MAEPSSASLQHVRDLFDSVEEAGGTAKRWWLEGHLSFVGNTSALNRWLQNLLDGGYLREVMLQDGHKGYQKTEEGEIFHAALKNHTHVKIFNSIIRHYSGERMKP